MSKLLFLLIAILTTPTFILTAQISLVVNERPIIGILAQEIYRGNGQPPNNSYIAASYVKFVEGGGAQVVPILINQNETYIRSLFSKINGLLFPGGMVNFHASMGSRGFVDTGRLLLQLAKEANDRGDFFPVWGTCLGFEFLLYEAAGGKEVRAECGAWDVPDVLKFTKDAMTSRLFSSAPKQVVKALATEALSPNFHRFCITPKNFSAFALDSEYSALSLNYDKAYKLTYISSVEHKRYPFYGVQFHPEKSIYEWNQKENIPHSPNAINAGQFFAKFFTDQARKSGHKFATQEEENKHLIYNYSPSFSGLKGSLFVQKYYFPLSKY